MLEGVKPFAKFTVEYPTKADEFPEEALFEPHVRSGTLIMRVMADEPFEKHVDQTLKGLAMMRKLGIR